MVLQIVIMYICKIITKTKYKINIYIYILSLTPLWQAMRFITSLFLIVNLDVSKIYMSWNQSHLK